MKRLRARYGCPVEFTVDVVGGKWKTVILAWLKEAPHRYGELRARMPGISDKILTERLKDLENMDLVAVGPADENRSVRVYRLTERGESLRPVLDALYAWGEQAAPDWSVTIKPV